MSDLKSTIKFDSAQATQDEYNEQILKNSGYSENIRTLIQHATGSANKKKVPRLAFTEDPNNQKNYAGIYKIKSDLLPDTVIKKIRISNLLVATILRARANALSMFGHLRKDRFDIGVDISIKDEFKDHIDPEDQLRIDRRMNRFKKILLSCGHVDGLKETEKMTLSDFLYLQTTNGLSFGRFSTEIVRDEETEEFHRFRPTDAGTFYRALREDETAAGIRASSLKLLESITGTKIDPDVLKRDEYAWIQVINGQPKQAFTPDEMLVYNLFPSSDIEHNGYPVTPLDTALNAVTTYMGIETYNKLYFQNGRAAKGMLVIKSDEIDQGTIEDIKQQYNASINNVHNSFRTPIFGVSREDNVDWVATTSQKKDGEFEFLYDNVSRNIMASFNISPDELPGFSHLSRGTNQQSLSEANNEFKLLAARDTGIRPLIMKIQDFINRQLFPIIDPELAQLCNVSLSGFDAQTKEQESVRLQQDMPIHYTYDEVMQEVEKGIVGPHMMGNMPFNERYLQTLEQYKTVGEIQTFFADQPSGVVDPLLKYTKDPIFFQNLESMAQYNPEAVQAWFSTRKDSLDILKRYIEDYYEQEDIDDDFSYNKE